MFSKNQWAKSQKMSLFYHFSIINFVSRKLRGAEAKNVSFLPFFYNKLCLSKHQGRGKCPTHMTSLTLILHTYFWLYEMLFLLFLLLLFFSSFCSSVFIPVFHLPLLIAQLWVITYPQLLTATYNFDLCTNLQL